MAKKDAAAPKKEGRLKQIALVYRMTKKTDRWIGLILLAVFAVTAVVAYGVFLLVPGPWPFDVVTVLLFGLLSVLIVFGRRAQKSQYAQIDGQAGAAAAVLGQLKRGWKVDPGIAFNKNQDLVHRVVGPPGIVLVGEGNRTGSGPFWATSGASTSGSPPRRRSSRSSAARAPAPYPSPSSPGTSPSWAATSSRPK